MHLAFRLTEASRPKAIREYLLNAKCTQQAANHVKLYNRQAFHPEALLCYPAILYTFAWKGKSGITKGPPLAWSLLCLQDLPAVLGTKTHSKLICVCNCLSSTSTFMWFIRFSTRLQFSSFQMPEEKLCTCVPLTKLHTDYKVHCVGHYVVL